MSVDAATRGERSAEISHVAAAAVALGVLVALFYGTAAEIVTKWSNWSAFNHGFLIIPICLYLAWRQRREAAATEINPDLRGVGVVILAVFAWLVGQATNTLVIQEFSLVTIAQGVILTMYGWPMWRTLAFPLLYAYFAVPVGTSLVPHLQAVTAALAVNLLRVVGMPVFSDGDIISIPSGTFVVADECSGIGFLIASLAIGTLFAGITYRSWWRRAAFMVLTVVIPIVGNGVRAFGIIMLAYLTNNRLALGVDHVLYGWIFFSLLTFATLAIGTTFREKDEPLSALSPQAPRVDHTKSIRRVAVAGIVALIPVAIAAIYGARMDQRPVSSPIHLVLPRTAGPWQETDAVQDPLPPVFAAPDLAVSASYEKGISRVYLHIGYYVRNRRGAQALSSEHQFGQGQGWVMAGEGDKNVNIGNDLVSVHYGRIVKGEQRHAVWYWYWIDGRFTGSRYLAKLLEAKNKFLGGQDEAAVIAIGIDYDANAADADRALTDFASNLGWLQDVLNGRDAR